MLETLACPDSVQKEIGRRPFQKKCDVAGDNAEQIPDPTTKSVTPKQEPTSDLDQIIDVDWEDYASCARTDDEPK